MSPASKIIEDLKHSTLPLHPPLPGLEDYAPKPKPHSGVTESSFTETARIAQELKSIITQSPGWINLHASQREALDMFATQVGRILSGDSIHHWASITEFAKFGQEACG